MANIPILAVIGGSGLYQFPGLEDIKTLDIHTPFGKPSSPVITGVLSEKPVAFLSRHGIGHIFNPSEVNYRANIYALKSLGINRVVSVSACGSLREDYAPGHIIIPDQLFDFTRNRPRSFFGKGLVAHIGSADPYCNNLSADVYQAVIQTGVTTHLGGTLITIEGPRFSTKAESNLFRAWGMSIIGMTACPEAFLAREAEMCYTTMAHITDYDVWHVSEEPVSVEIVIRTMQQNTEVAQQAIKTLVEYLPTETSCQCDKSLADAFITHPDYFPPETINRLGLLVDKYLS